MSVACDRLFVGRIVGASNFGVFQVRPVINEGPDFDAIGELRHAPHVIAVVVSNQDIIQLLESGLMSSRNDSVRISAFVPGPACIDQKGLSRWAYQKRRLTTLDINEVNLQGLRSSGCSIGACGSKTRPYDCTQKSTHVGTGCGVWEIMPWQKPSGGCS